MMWIALAIHVTDEALTGFLAVYNPTVLALRAKLPFFPMPTFEFREWRTVSTVEFPRPAPGFYSSPLLFAAAIYAWVQLRRTATSAA
jgi:hypothetical protein